MGISTAILITLGLLAAYYTGMVCYDLYLDQLAQANKDEDSEQAVDISGQVSDFQTIPVNKSDEKEEKQNRFENLLRAGITAEKAERMMRSIAEGSEAKQLEDVMYIIREHQTESAIL